MAPWRVGSILIVEDTATLTRTLLTALTPHCDEIRAAQSVAEARGLLQDFRPHLVVLDVALPDGTGFDVLDALAEGPTPAIVALSGEAGPDQSFELAKQGVAVFVRKPLALGRLERAIERALAAAPDLGPQLRGTVGHRPLHEVEEEVRRVMVDEALKRSSGSRRAAARLLRVSRQLLQYILRRLG